MTNQEELELIKRVLDGEPDTFEELVNENQKNVYNLALRMTGNEDDALDVSQDVFIKAYTGLSGFRGDSRFSVWLYRLTYNMCIDLSRRKKRRPEVSLSRADEDSDDTELEIPDMRYTPESEFEKKELRRTVRTIVDSLSPEHRQVLIMREYGDMSYERIAEVLHVSEGTIKSRISRARKCVVKKLIENGTIIPSERLKSRKEGAFDE